MICKRHECEDPAVFERMQSFMQGGDESKGHRAKMGNSDYEFEGREQRERRDRAKADFKPGGFEADLDLFGGPSGFVCRAHRCQSFFNFSKFRYSRHFVSDGTFGFGFSRVLFATV